MIKARDYSKTASPASCYDLLLTVFWPVNRTTKVTVAAVTVQTIVFKACVCAWERLCVAGCTTFSVCSVSLVLISAEGFKASNTLSWLGTSDILFTSLPLWTTDPLWGGKKNKSHATSSFCISLDTALKLTVAVVFMVTNAVTEPCIDTWDACSSCNISHHWGDINVRLRECW